MTDASSTSDSKLTDGLSSVILDNENNKTQPADPTQMTDAANDMMQKMSRGISFASVSPQIENATLTSAMQKMTSGVSFAYDPYYGTWTFYFVDTKGNTLYYPVGCVDSTSDQAESYVTKYVKEVENKGYVFKNDIMYSQITVNYAYNYVTLIFDKAPLVQGGNVTVQYVDSTTNKVLQTGTATYTDNNGNPSSAPYVGYKYTTNIAVIPGYTVSSIPSNASGTVTKNAQTVIYQYTPNKENAQIQIIDDSEGGKVINTVTVNGTYGSTSTYDINSYLNSNYPNYNVESDNWPGSITWDSSNDGTVPTYQVKLTHKTQSSTDTKTVTQTIKYQYSDGTQAEPTKTSSITFTRPATKDLVTGNVTYGSWTNETGTDEFPSVQSP